ncbi:recombinase family protein [Desulfobacter curvatus]|uniref:recombinase family protein n=1 Tax=Desulfobacter curvatus TaxID=2290 RepID=UPI00036DCD30|nr:recombinase family protein [Desulfobacter curvatus]
MQKLKTVAYLRVSTSGQDLEKNKADILLFANDRKFGHVDFVEEKVSGKKHWKDRKIKTIIDKLGAGDRLIVPELSRLGRSMLEIMEILSVAKEKEICIYALKGNWELNGTIQSKLIAMCFSMAAEIERDLISSRTKEALKARKAAGVKLGRPKGPGKSMLDPHKEEIVALLKNGTTKTWIANKYNTTLPNLYNWLKKNKIQG